MKWMDRIKRTVKTKAKSLAGKWLKEPTANFAKKVDIPDVEDPIPFKITNSAIGFVSIIQEEKPLVMNKAITIRKQSSQRKNWNKWKKRL